MAYIYDKEYTRYDLLARVGDISQIARVKPYRLTDGLEDGVQALDVTTGSGFEFTVLPSRGMDIATASYNGRPLAWRSATTNVHPAYFDHEGERGRGWLRSFYGGLVVTCGLTWAGANDIEDGQQYGLHGRISNLPASNVSVTNGWAGNEYTMIIRGEIREATVFGENLRLARTISTSLGSNHFKIHDAIENMGVKSTPHMMLYHINIGFPILGDNGYLVAPSMSVLPRDEEAVRGETRYAQFQPPEVGFREQVYFHKMVPNENGRVTAAIVNPDCPAGSGEGPGLGVYCEYDPHELPNFIEWKMMDSGTYVVGMEPANCLVMGRPHDRQRGALKYLEPGESAQYHLEIGVLDGPKPIEFLKHQCDKAVNEALHGEEKP